MKQNERELENNVCFWQKLDTIWLSSHFVLDKAKGQSHAFYKNLVYPVDYGYLADTMGTDGKPINAYMGSKKDGQIEAIIVTCDILNKDCVVKVLIGCTDKDMEIILKFVNSTEFQKAILVHRGNESPAWAGY